MPRSSLSRTVVVALVGGAGLLAGCGDVATDKAGGGEGHEARVLRLANHNPEPGELEPFAREVARASHGRLRIEFVNGWREGESNSEPGVLDDVRAGKVDLAWVGARAFKAEGVRALDPLVAPFAVTDYATEEKLLASPIAAEMLDAVAEAGVRGIAILPGPLQRLGMREPWRTAADLRGKRIGAPAGIGGEAVKALGARPVAVGSGGSLRAVDGSGQLHLTAFLANHYAPTLPYVATQALWPRPPVVIAGSRVWARLSRADRNALLEAGRLAAGPGLALIRAGERSALPLLCRQGARFFRADVADLRRAVEPVYAEMRRDAVAARVLAAIDGMRTPDTAAPIACAANHKTAAGGPPSGTYTWTITRAEALQAVPAVAQQPDFLAQLPAFFRAVIRSGHIVIYVSSRGAAEEVGFDADISVFEDRAEFDAGDGHDKQTARWSLAGDDLRFSDVTSGADGQVVMTTKPWTRVR